MRDLTAKQKSLIKTWFIANKENIKAVGGGLVRDWHEYDFFPIELFEELEKINDTEVLSQNVSHYIRELVNRG
jgi:hypothetical protein